jgi:hypothetical protein
MIISNFLLIYNSHSGFECGNNTPYIHGTDLVLKCSKKGERTVTEKKKKKYEINF